jgi:hypothetical protein
MKKSLPMVRMCWGMMNELLNGSHQVEGRKYRYIQERFYNGAYVELRYYRINKATGERERVQVRRK